MMVFRIVFWALFTLISIGVQGQSKKLIRTYGVKSMTETTYKFDKGVEELPYVSFIEKFDKQGDWIERKEFNKDGSIKILEKRGYVQGLLISELKEEGPQKAKEEKPASFNHNTYEYVKGLLVYEKDWSRDSTLISSKDYEYDKFGQKISEVERNSKGEIKKNETFSYDSKGFRNLKLTHNAEGELTEKMVYAYE